MLLRVMLNTPCYADATLRLRHFRFLFFSPLITLMAAAALRFRRAD